MTASSQPPAPVSIRVLLGDGRPLIRAGLIRLLSNQPEIAVVADVAGAADLADAVAACAPDIVVLDSQLPGGAIHAARSLRLQRPALAILLYGLDESESDVLEALQAGVRGFAGQEADIEGLTRSIRSVAAGELMASPRLARHIETLFGGLRSQEGARPGETGDPLTDRELEVLALVASGASNRGVAAALGLSEHTIRAHLRSASRKLGVRNRVQAVSAAIRKGSLVGEGSPTGQGLKGA